MNVAVEASGVVRRFKNGRGLGPVSLTVHDGECVAIMGPNGAGKTTLLRLLATADTASSGEIMWSSGRRPREVRRQLGFAPDTVVEEGSLTARQATHFWCSQWVARQDAPARVTAALRLLDLDAVADEPVSGFSFGMRRRLGLAQALAHQPHVLLLDEPTAGLDPAGVDILQQVVRDRCAVAQTTIIGSNDPVFVAAACDRVVFLDDGVVLRDATPSALLAELRGTRRVELLLDEGADMLSLQSVAGVGTVTRMNGSVLVELMDDTALPRVVAAADSAPGTLHGLTVHTPDLADSFRMLTGRPLAPERALV